MGRDRVRYLQMFCTWDCRSRWQTGYNRGIEWTQQDDLWGSALGNLTGPAQARSCPQRTRGAGRPHT